MVCWIREVWTELFTLRAASTSSLIPPPIIKSAQSLRLKRMSMWNAQWTSCLELLVTIRQVSTSSSL
jgi:hypothetical protein